MKTKLKNSIDKYLETRVESTGGYAPATFDEMWELDGIIRDLIIAKYGPDPDGDYPIEVRLTNRVKQQRLSYNALPYLEMHSSYSDVFDYIKSANRNLAVAYQDVNRGVDQLEWVTKQIENNWDGG